MADYLTVFALVVLAAAWTVQLIRQRRCRQAFDRLRIHGAEMRAEQRWTLDARIAELERHYDLHVAAESTEQPTSWHVTACVHQPITAAQADGLFDAVADIAADLTRQGGPDVDVSGGPCHCQPATGTDTTEET